jgi:hypothetical protein
MNRYTDARCAGTAEPFDRSAPVAQLGQAQSADQEPSRLGPVWIDQAARLHEETEDKR